MGFAAAPHPISKSSTAVIAVTAGLHGLVQEAAPGLPEDVQVVDAVPAVVGGLLYALGRNASTAADGAPATMLVSVDAAAGAIRAVPLTITAGDPAPPNQWTALVAMPAKWPAGSLAGVAIAGSGSAFLYQIRMIDPATGAAGPAIMVSTPQNTFVNFQFATTARLSGEGVTQATFHFLAGDENSLTALNAVVFTATLQASGSGSTLNSVPLDGKVYTLGSLALDEMSGILYALSPGLYGATNWTLVTLDPASGAVAAVGTLGPSSEASPWRWGYSGGVAGGIPFGTDFLLHILQHELDGSYAILKVGLADGAIVTASSLLLGVNNELALMTSAYMAS